MKGVQRVHIGLIALTRPFMRLIRPAHEGDPAIAMRLDEVAHHGANALITVRNDRNMPRSFGFHNHNRQSAVLR